MQNGLFRTKFTKLPEDGKLRLLFKVIHAFMLASFVLCLVR